MPRPCPPPPEWAPQSALWVGWPRLREEWGAVFEAARGEIARFVSVARKVAAVRIAVGDDAAEAAARAALGPGADLRRVRTGDIWLRDTGPVFARGPEGRTAHVFRFNGWGGKYDMPGDRDTAADIAAAEAAATVRHDFVLEGGAVEMDGTGTVITTRECLLNANRNGWSEAAAETALENAFGARRIIWLDAGLAGDHTDGHVDNLARFIAPGRAVCQRPSGADDPHAERLGEVEAVLRRAGLDVETLPSPGRIERADGAPLPASHMNFVLSNGALILPVYDRESGRAAAAALATLAPHLQIIPLPAGAILTGGGSFHCMSCHVPALVAEGDAS